MFVYTVYRINAPRNQSPNNHRNIDIYLCMTTLYTLDSGHYYDDYYYHQRTIESTKSEKDMETKRDRL